MLKLLKPVTAIGLEQLGSHLKVAQVSLNKGLPFIHHLFEVADLEDQNIKLFHKTEALVTTGLWANEVLVRPLQLPLTKEKDLDSALAFQAEPLLPYPGDQAILARQTLSQTSEGTLINVLSVRKDLLKKHLESYEQWKIEPENVSCIQTALCQFGLLYVKTEKPFLILHLNEKTMTCVLIQEGKLLSSFTQPCGLEQLYSSTNEDLSQIDLGLLSPESPFLNSLKRFSQLLSKMTFALCKEVKADALEGILVTGEVLKIKGIDQYFSKIVSLNLLTCSEPNPSFSSLQMQEYAVPLGLACEALVKTKNPINFRQQEFIYPHPWKRIKGPLIAYTVLMMILTTSFYFFGQHYLRYQEDQLKQEYVELLAAMNKSYDHFENAFLVKNAQAREKSNGEIVKAIHLGREDLLERLEFLHRDLQATPDSFPLFANIPRVSDVLAWLSNHPLVVGQKEDGTPESRLQLESFVYTMLKRPVQGKKQEKYQVKVEIEFSSPTPTWAREFHDALIAPNDLVDPKAEVKWSSNRGRYRTSFYLKDKTLYPSQ